MREQSTDAGRRLVVTVVECTVNGRFVRSAGSCASTVGLRGKGNPPAVQGRAANLGRL